MQGSVGHPLGTWICKICSEIFHDQGAFQNHWDAEMKMALATTEAAVRNFEAPQEECNQESDVVVGGGSSGSARSRAEVPPAATDEQAVRKIKIRRVVGGGDMPRMPFRICFDLANSNADKVKAEKMIERKVDISVFSDARGRCPVCSKSCPLAKLQEHVEEELEIMDAMADRTQPVSQEQHKQRGGYSSFKMQAKPGNRSLLILGDDPQPHKKTRLAEEPNRSTGFNHYADGRGWWDEDHLGIDVAEGGDLLWEGLGSVRFRS